MVTARENAPTEFIGGRLSTKPPPDGDHAQIIASLQRSCAAQRPDLWLFPRQGVRVGKHREEAARPDGVLAPADYFAGQGEWTDPSGVLVVVEVTSHHLARYGHTEKLRAYAETGIPTYVLIDRATNTITVHSEPHTGRYDSTTHLTYGDDVQLPALDITLNTKAVKRGSH